MSKPFSTIGGSATGSGGKSGGIFLILLVLAGIAVSKLVLGGVSPAVAVPVAIGAAFLIDRALFGSWK